jgi:hypothetical protein
MAKTALHKMMDEVKRLTPDEQRQLRDAIDKCLSAVSVPPTEEEFERELFETGFLERIEPFPMDSHDFQDERPIDILGKPLSETIIEERR